MNKIPVFTALGNKKSEMTAPVNFRPEANPKLLAQALRVYEVNFHPSLAETKTRGEVKGSTRKIYRQKGTGYARHGAKSAPIFVGGGIAHGPKGIKRRLLLPAKMKSQALGLALASKLANGDLVAVDSLSDFKKTKQASDCTNKITLNLKKVKGKITFVIADHTQPYFALKNIQDSNIKIFKNLSPYDVFYGGLMIFDQSIFAKPKRVVRKATK